MESRFSHDFGQVRVHADAAAARSAGHVQARAYTVGSHVVFAAGQYQPATDRGNHLLAHELTHVVQQGNGHWWPETLRIGEPGDPDEAIAERVADGMPARPSSGAGAVLRRQKWEAAKSPDCAQGKWKPPQPGAWLEKVVVDQEKRQSATLHWSNGTATASICSTGKAHCCIDSKDPNATAADVTKSRSDKSNATPIGTGFKITDTLRLNNGWDFWNTFVPSPRDIALHQHDTVTGAPISHGCVRLPKETAHDIFCGARQGQTQVEVRGFARPDCADPDLKAEWKDDFTRAGSVTDGDPVSADVREVRQELQLAYGHKLSGAELERGEQEKLAIPRCGSRGAPPSAEERRAMPEVKEGSTGPSKASPAAEFLASSGLESFIPKMAHALDRAGTLGTAQAAAGGIGRELWNKATEKARGGRSDDRPLYWARVELTRTIRQAQPGFGLTDVSRAALIETFDRASRGMSTAQFHGPAGAKRIVISGFDPYVLDPKNAGDIKATNPSGAAALALDGRTLTNGAVRGTVESVVFPISFAAFDAGIVENFFRPFLHGRNHADMIMTISMGDSDAYKVEQYAGRTRGTGLADNPGVTPSASGNPPGLAAGPQFIKGTLPASVRGPRDALATAETSVIEVPAGKSAHVTSRAGPTPGSTAVAGSGGEHLSNEIFYRVGLLQLAEGSHIPFGHLRVPRLSPKMSDYATRRDQIVQRVQQILTAALPDL